MYNISDALKIFIFWEKIAEFLLTFSMEFVLYRYAVSLLPGGGWRHFWRQFTEIWRLGYIFGQKMDVLQISRFESVRPTEARFWQIFQKLWRNCEFCTPSSPINRGVLISDNRPCFDRALSIVTRTVTSTSVILNSCAWLLLFEVLRETSEVLSLCLVSCEICLLRWVWTAWNTATGSACSFYQFILVTNFLSFKRLFIDSQLHASRRS